jgi:cytochrome c5
MIVIRSTALIAVLVLSPLIALAAPAPEPMHFTSQSIEMPTSDRIFPDGPGAEVVNNNCLACHSAGMVLTQPKLTKAQWTETVNKMVHVYKAPVDQTDVQTIVDYLAALKPQP